MELSLISKPTADELRKIEDQVQACSSALAGSDVEEWLLEERSLEAASIASARLGLVTDKVARDYPDLRYRVGMLTIPYLSPSGKVLDFRFRNMTPGADAKYLGRTGSSVRLYNYPDLNRAVDTLHLTEGELDALTLSQAGFPALGIPGAQSVSELLLEPVMEFYRVILWADTDEAGEALADTLKLAMRQCLVARLPEAYKDVSEMYALEGQEGLEDVYQRTIRQGG